MAQREEDAAPAPPSLLLGLPVSIALATHSQLNPSDPAAVWRVMLLAARGNDEEGDAWPLCMPIEAPVDPANDSHLPVTALGDEEFRLLRVEITGAPAAVEGAFVLGVQLLLHGAIVASGRQGISLRDGDASACVVSLALFACCGDRHGQMELQASFVLARDTHPCARGQGRGPRGGGIVPGRLPKLLVAAPSWGLDPREVAAQLQTLQPRPPSAPSRLWVSLGALGFGGIGGGLHATSAPPAGLDRWGVALALSRGDGELLGRPQHAGCFFWEEGVGTAGGSPSSPGGCWVFSGGAGGGGCVLELPSSDGEDGGEQDLHLLLYVITPNSALLLGDEDAAAGDGPTAAAFAYLSLYGDSLQQALAGGEREAAIFIADARHSHARHGTAAVHGGALGLRVTAPLRLYPGSPPYLPLAQSTDGGAPAVDVAAWSGGQAGFADGAWAAPPGSDTPLFAPSPPTRRVAGDTVGGGNERGPPPHLRLLEPLPPPPGDSESSRRPGSGDPAPCNPLQVGMGDGGDGGRGGPCWFPSSIRVCVTVQDGRPGCVADDAVAALVAGAGQGEEAEEGGTHDSSGGPAPGVLLASALSASRGSLLPLGSTHPLDAAKQAEPLVVALVRSYLGAAQTLLVDGDGRGGPGTKGVGSPSLTRTAGLLKGGRRAAPRGRMLGWALFQGQRPSTPAGGLASPALSAARGTGPAAVDVTLDGLSAQGADLVAGELALASGSPGLQGGSPLPPPDAADAPATAAFALRCLGQALTLLLAAAPPASDAAFPPAGGPDLGPGGAASSLQGVLDSSLFGRVVADAGGGEAGAPFYEPGLLPPGAVSALLDACRRAVRRLWRAVLEDRLRAEQRQQHHPLQLLPHQRRLDGPWGQVVPPLSPEGAPGAAEVGLLWEALVSWGSAVALLAAHVATTGELFGVWVGQGAPGPSPAPLGPAPPSLLADPAAYIRRHLTDWVAAAAQAACLLPHLPGPPSAEGALGPAAAACLLRLLPLLLRQGVALGALSPAHADLAACAVLAAVCEGAGCALLQQATQRLSAALHLQQRQEGGGAEAAGEPENGVAGGALGGQFPGSPDPASRWLLQSSTRGVSNGAPAPPPTRLVTFTSRKMQQLQLANGAPASTAAGSLTPAALSFSSPGGAAAGGLFSPGCSSDDASPAAAADPVDAASLPWEDLVCTFPSGAEGAGAGDTVPGGSHWEGRRGAALRLAGVLLEALVGEGDRVRGHATLARAAGLCELELRGMAAAWGPGAGGMAALVAQGSTADFLRLLGAVTGELQTPQAQPPTASAPAPSPPFVWGAAQGLLQSLGCAAAASWSAVGRWGVPGEGGGRQGPLLLAGQHHAKSLGSGAPTGPSSSASLRCWDSSPLGLAWAVNAAFVALSGSAATRLHNSSSSSSTARGAHPLELARTVVAMLAALEPHTELLGAGGSAPPDSGAPDPSAALSLLQAWGDWAIGAGDPATAGPGAAAALRRLLEAHFAREAGPWTGPGAAQRRWQSDDSGPPAGTLASVEAAGPLMAAGAWLTAANTASAFLLAPSASPFPAPPGPLSFAALHGALCGLIRALAGAALAPAHPEHPHGAAQPAPALALGDAEAIVEWAVQRRGDADPQAGQLLLPRSPAWAGEGPGPGAHGPAPQHLSASTALLAATLNGAVRCLASLSPHDAQQRRGGSHGHHHQHQQQQHEVAYSSSAMALLDCFVSSAHVTLQSCKQQSGLEEPTAASAGRAAAAGHVGALALRLMVEAARVVAASPASSPVPEELHPRLTRLAAIVCSSLRVACATAGHTGHGSGSPPAPANALHPVSQCILALAADAAASPLAPPQPHGRAEGGAPSSAAAAAAALPLLLLRNLASAASAAAGAGQGGRSRHAHSGHDDDPLPRLLSDLRLTEAALQAVTAAASDSSPSTEVPGGAPPSPSPLGANALEGLRVLLEMAEGCGAHGAAAQLCAAMAAHHGAPYLGAGALGSQSAGGAAAFIEATAAVCGGGSALPRLMGRDALCAAHCLALRLRHLIAAGSAPAADAPAARAAALPSPLRSHLWRLCALAEPAAAAAAFTALLGDLETTAAAAYLGACMSGDWALAAGVAATLDAAVTVAASVLTHDGADAAAAAAVAALLRTLPTQPLHPADGRPAAAAGPPLAAPQLQLTVARGRAAGTLVAHSGNEAAAAATPAQSHSGTRRAGQNPAATGEVPAAAAARWRAVAHGPLELPLPSGAPSHRAALRPHLLPLLVMRREAAAAAAAVAEAGCTATARSPWSPTGVLASGAGPMTPVPLPPLAIDLLLATGAGASGRGAPDGPAPSRQSPASYGPLLESLRTVCALHAAGVSCPLPPAYMAVGFSGAGFGLRGLAPAWRVFRLPEGEGPAALRATLAAAYPAATLYTPKTPVTVVDTTALAAAASAAPAHGGSAAATPIAPSLCALSGKAPPPAPGGGHSAPTSGAQPTPLVGELAFLGAGSHVAAATVWLQRSLGTSPAPRGAPAPESPLLRLRDHVYLVPLSAPMPAPASVTLPSVLALALSCHAPLAEELRGGSRGLEAAAQAPDAALWRAHAGAWPQPLGEAGRGAKAGKPAGAQQADKAQQHAQGGAVFLRGWLACDGVLAAGGGGIAPATARGGPPSPSSPSHDVALLHTPLSNCGPCFLPLGAKFNPSVHDPDGLLTLPQSSGAPSTASLPTHPALLRFDIALAVGAEGGGPGGSAAESWPEAVAAASMPVRWLTRSLPAASVSLAALPAALAAAASAATALYELGLDASRLASRGVALSAPAGLAVGLLEEEAAGLALTDPLPGTPMELADCACPALSDPQARRLLGYPPAPTGRHPPPARQLQALLHTYALEDAAAYADRPACGAPQSRSPDGAPRARDASAAALAGSGLPLGLRAHLLGCARLPDPLLLGAIVPLLGLAQPGACLWAAQRLWPSPRDFQEYVRRYRQAQQLARRGGQRPLPHLLTQQLQLASLPLPVLLLSQGLCVGGALGALAALGEDADPSLRDYRPVSVRLGEMGCVVGRADASPRASGPPSPSSQSTSVRLLRELAGQAVAAGALPPPISGTALRAAASSAAGALGLQLLPQELAEGVLGAPSQQHLQPLMRRLGNKGGGGSDGGALAAWAESGGAAPSCPTARLPALCARISNRLARWLSPDWVAPGCGLAGGRALLLDYADLRVTWREKRCTQMKREWIREEAALAAAGVDTSVFEMPDFAASLLRPQHALVTMLEAALGQAQTALLRGVQLHGHLAGGAVAELEAAAEAASFAASAAPASGPEAAAAGAAASAAWAVAELLLEEHAALEEGVNCIAAGASVMPPVVRE